MGAHLQVVRAGALMYSVWMCSAVGDCGVVSFSHAKRVSVTQELALACVATRGHCSACACEAAGG